jgi:rhodanese-related sulfurtransferase
LSCGGNRSEVDSGDAVRFLGEAMSRIIGRAEVRRMTAHESAQLVEVLPREEYESEHIVGAINLPLKEIADQAERVLDRDRPVILYCNDFQ